MVSDALVWCRITMADNGLQIGGRFNAANVLLAVVGIFTENACLEY